MTPILLALAALVAAAGVPALLFARPRAGLRLGLGLSTLACAAGGIASAAATVGGARAEFRTPWAVPYGEFHLALDPLSSFFLTVLFALGGACSLYGSAHLEADLGHRRVLGQASLFPLLCAAIALLFLAADAVLFLAAWEGMTLVATLLILHESERADVRRAGLLYLVMNHVAAAALVVAWLLLAGARGTTDLVRMAELAPAAIPSAALVFGAALIGFATKAGVMPFHVWLPLAHPVAPSHVSALLSGLLLKTGIYGLLRMAPLLGPPSAGFGAVLLVLGAASGVLGVVYALAQHEIKRLLAYHSIENVGIILMGIGVGVLGASQGVAAAAVAGYAGGVLHVANHALFKGCLFLGAGAVRHATGTGSLDRQGGLSRRMPTTAVTFATASAAISGLPPLNGFVSEFLVASGALALFVEGHGTTAVLGLLVLASLALIGGLACLCFVKVVGAVFLGRPRSAAAASAHEASLRERAAMTVTAALCVFLGVAAPLALRFVAPVARDLAGPAMHDAASTTLDGLASALASVAAACGLALALALALLLLRRGLLSRRAVRRSPTWGCGFGAPTPRMQYTASSFAAPTTRLFAPVLGTQVQGGAPVGLYPGPSPYETHTGDRVEDRVLEPVLARLLRTLAIARRLQQGSLHRYLLYVLLTLTALLVWTLVA